MAKILRVKGSTAPAKAEAPEAKKPKAAKKDVPSKYLGRTTGMRVMAFQDKLMRENFKAKFTDEVLAQKMRDEFPMAAKFTVAHVAGIRSQFNHGKRASQDGVAPARTLTAFDESGNAIERGKGSGRRPAAPAKEKAAKPVKMVAKKKVAKDEEEEETEE